MDCRRSFGIQSRKNTFWSHVAVPLLLSFSICIVGAVGSEHELHFKLRGGKLTRVIALSPPPLKAPLPPNASPEPQMPPSSPASPPPPISSSPPGSPQPSLSLSPPMSTPHPPTLPSPMLSPPSVVVPTLTPLPPLSSPVEPPPPLQVSPLEPPPPPPPPTIVNPADTWNNPEKAGVVMASIAALLQVAVVAFLLIKRHQMLTTVEYEDFDNEYDNPDLDHSRPQSA